MAKKKKKRLNVKFLVILTSAVAVVLVLAVIAGYFYKQSPGRAIRRAQEAEQVGDWETAAGQWAKAARYSNNDPALNLKAINAALHQTTGDRGQEMLNTVFGAYSAMLATDPTNLDALRGEMRLYYQSGRLDRPSADPQTREVRRVAEEILKQLPGDPEAKTLHALATLNLSGFSGEGVTPAQTEQARKDLEEVATTEPGDGLAVVVLALRRLNDADQARQQGDPAEALSRWQAAVGLVDQVAAKVGDLKPDADPDAILLRRRIGEAYRAAAQLKPYLDAAQLAKNGTPVTPEQSQALLDDPLTKQVADKGIASLAAAAGALNDDRDKMGDFYRQTLVTYADALQQRGESAQSEAVLRRLTQARPWDAGSASVLARLLQQTGKLEEAVAVLREQRKRDEEPLPDLTGFDGLSAQAGRFGVQPQLADLLLSRRDQFNDPQEKEAMLKEAADLFQTFDAQRVARGYNESALSTRLRGQIQLARGESDALATLGSALRMTEGAKSSAEQYERLRTLDLLVRANRQLNQVGSVTRYLEEMARLRPGAAQVQAQLAEALLAQGERDRAKPIIDLLLKAQPDNAVYQQLAARATPAAEQEASYAGLPEADPAQRRAKLVAANRLNKRDEVIRLARAVLADSPDDTQIALGLAQALHAAGQDDEAVALLEKLPESVAAAPILLAEIRGGTDEAIAAMPDGVNKLVLQAQVAAGRGDAAGALDKLKAARALEPGNARVANALFDAYVAQNDLPAATALAGQLKEDNGDGMNGRAYDLRLALARGETERSVREAGALASDFPQLAEAQGLQGATLVRAGRPADAVDSYRRALDLAPNNGGLLGGMVNALNAAGRGRDVKPYLDAAVRAEPNNRGYRNALAAYELQYGDAQTVLNRLRDAVDAAPDSADARLSLGQALLGAGVARRQADAPDGGPESQKLLAQAVDAYQAGLQKFPQDGRFLQGMVTAATRGGGKLPETVAPAVDRAMSAGGADATLASDPPTAASAAEFYVARGEPAKAEDVLRRAVAATGSDQPRERKAGLLLALSETLARQGRVDDAVSVLNGYEDLDPVRERQVNLLATRAANNPADAAAYDTLRKISDAPLEAGKLTPGAINAIAFAELQRGDLGRAESLLGRSAAERPGDARTLFFQGAVEARKPGGSLARAAELLDAARAQNPQDRDVLRELARVQRRTGQADEAAATLARLSDVQPKDVQTRLDLLSLLMTANPPRVAEAGRVLREADAAGIGQDPRLLLARSRVELSRNRVDDALATAAQAADAAKGSPLQDSVANAYLGLALQQNRPDLVLQRTQAAAAAGTDAPWWMLRARGEALARLNRRAESADAYARAFRAAGSGPAAAQVIREMAQRVGFDPAYALIKPAVEPSDGSPPDVGALEMAGTLYAVTGQTRRAIDLLKQADASADASADGADAKMTPQQRATLQAALGSLYLQADPPQFDEAEPLFRAALKVRPRDLGTLNNLAYALSAQAERAGDGSAAASKRAEAVEFARQAYDLAQGAVAPGRPANPQVTDTYAWALAVKAMADSDGAALGQAIDLLREAQAAAEDAGDPFAEVYLHLSRSLAGRQDGPGAVEAAEAGLGVLARQREAKQPVDAGVEQQLKDALAAAQKLGGGDGGGADKAVAADAPAGG